MQMRLYIYRGSILFECKLGKLSFWREMNKLKLDCGGMGTRK